MTRTHSRIAAPMAALGFLALLAGCGSDSETVTKRTVIQDQPQTVRTETTTTTVEVGFAGQPEPADRPGRPTAGPTDRADQAVGGPTGPTQ